MQWYIFGVWGGIAIVGISVSYGLGKPALDGLASIVIGIILAAVAGLLAYERKGLLVGESADTQAVVEWFHLAHFG